MNARRLVFLWAVAAAASGCAPRRPLATNPVLVPWDGKADLTLDQITPIPHLNAPATQPQDRPPMDALMLYTQARDAMLRSDWQEAIGLLDRAIGLDPYQFDLRFDLGRVYVNAGNADESAIAAFEKAAILRPDRLDVQAELGRLYLGKSNLPAALLHLRLATQCPAYATDDTQAAGVDFYLGQALKNLGYDRAALDQFTHLLTRLENPSLALQQSGEMQYLLSRSDSLLEQIGEIFEKHRDFKDALKAFQPAVDREPDNFELQARYARDLALDGERDPALAHAVDLVVRNRASAASLQLLRDVCRDLKINDGVVGELRKLSKRRPADHAVLFALADTLVSKNRDTEAWDLLESSWEKNPADIPITRRLFALDRDQNQVEAAAALLIHALAANPDALQNYEPLWLELRRYGQTNRLGLVSLRLMKIPPDDEASRQVWLSVTAGVENRSTLQRTALQTAIQHTPPFAPAFRLLLERIFQRPDWNIQQKEVAVDELIGTARNSGDPSLGAELRGRWLMLQKQYPQAIDAFAPVLKTPGVAPQLLLAAAQANLLAGNDRVYEQMMWKIISEHPMFEEAYVDLDSHDAASNDPGAVGRQMKVISVWRGNDPQSFSARLAQAHIDASMGRNAEAAQEYSRLFEENPYEPNLFADMVGFFNQAGRLGELISKLEDARQSHSRDVDLASRLAGLYADQKRTAEAIRLLDTTRQAVADDADQLYFLAAAYSAMNQKATATEVLQQVLQLDPTHARACNDLGFQWADQGKNLPQAESLIRIAVASQPDNNQFLDSLGWVLYKRGNLEEAKKYLQLAAAPMMTPDPVVMNHLGDTLYRLSQAQAALSSWKQSLSSLGDETDHVDQRQLRLQLLQKIRQAEAKKPVDLSS
jgi:tetratricopeptide (TPR) repeat protein